MTQDTLSEVLTSWSHSKLTPAYIAASEAYIATMLDRDLRNTPIPVIPGTCVARELFYRGFCRGGRAMTRRTLALLAALTLPACAAPDPDGFRVAADIRVQFEVAARGWCDAGARCAYQDPDGPSEVVRVDDVGEGLLGRCYDLPDGASAIHIREDDDPAIELAAIAHELGHHFGCGHSDDPEDLMYPVVRPLVTTPTAHDVECAR